jgi:hypothetical protein
MPGYRVNHGRHHLSSICFVVTQGVAAALESIDEDEHDLLLYFVKTLQLMVIFLLGVSIWPDQMLIFLLGVSIWPDQMLRFEPAGAL